jgi:predicted secreted Zn-dependent protease
MADVKKMALAGGAGLALMVLKRTPLRRIGTAIVVTRTVWKDPRVQKVRHRVQKRVEKEVEKRAAKK